MCIYHLPTLRETWQLRSPKFSKHVRYNINVPPFCSPQTYQLVAVLPESIDIRGSRDDDAPIKPSSTLGLLLDFIFMATRTACLPQSAFSNCILCATMFHFKFL